MNISINELRVGNLVSINNGFEMIVHSIFRDNTVYLDFVPPLINEGDIWEEDLKDINPITLTRELFLKFGFTDRFNNYHGKEFWTIPNLKIAFRNEGDGAHVPCTNNEFLFSKGNRIKYVHQLQNLYFALTGEELKLNNN